jgi:hypothetical protein
MKALICAASILATTPYAGAATMTFDSDEVGQPPAGWMCGTTGKGTPLWTVEADASAPSLPNVLKQAGVAQFPWCIKEGTDTSNGTVEVKFKPVSGKEDQAGGLVWRWKDGNNYYVARANAFENNVSLYYTVNGVRKTLKYVDAPVASNAWHTLRVKFRDNAIEVALDGKTYIDTKDSHISGTGKVGVWTKADSVTAFDDFSYSSAAGR